MFSIPGLTIWLIAAGVVVLAMTSAGLWLIKRGFMPKRQGTEPHCRKCSYILTGIASERCPECGGALAGRAIVFGQRVRRPRLAIVGTIMVLPALMIPVGIGWSMRHPINWYHYGPTFFLMREVRAGSAGAWQEIDRREQAGTLTGADRSKLIDLALEEQVSVKPTPLLNDLLGFLVARFRQGGLTDQQMQRLKHRILDVSLHVRPIVVAGEQVPGNIRYPVHVPPEWGAFSDVQWRESQLDGAPISVHASHFGSAFDFECAQPGTHKA